MAPYVPNATQTNEPLASESVESAAAEFRTLKLYANTEINSLHSQVNLFLPTFVGMAGFPIVVNPTETALEPTSSLNNIVVNYSNIHTSALNTCVIATSAITGSTIDSTTIGATTPNTGVFTSVDTGQLSSNSSSLTGTTWDVNLSGFVVKGAAGSANTAIGIQDPAGVYQGYLKFDSVVGLSVLNSTKDLSPIVGFNAGIGRFDLLVATTETVDTVNATIVNAENLNATTISGSLSQSVAPSYTVALSPFSNTIGAGYDIQVHNDVLTGIAYGPTLKFSGADAANTAATQGYLRSEPDSLTVLAGSGGAYGNLQLNNLTAHGTIELDSATLGTITGLSAPTATSDAATKLYVDTAISNLLASAPGTLDTLNELAVALGTDPNFATTIAAALGTKLALAGGTMTGNIDMGTFKITGSPTPTLNSDYVNVGYVTSIAGTLVANEASVLLARQWASEAENVLVAATDYSAKHYAAKTEANTIQFDVQFTNMASYLLATQAIVAANHPFVSV